MSVREPSKFTEVAPPGAHLQVVPPNAKSPKKEPKRLTFSMFCGATEEAGIAFSRNVHSHRIYVGNEPMAGHEEAGLRTEIEKHCAPFSLSADRFRQWTGALADQVPIDPFRDWIDDLTDPVDDGPSIDTWAEELWGVESSEFLRFAAASVFVTPVLLAYRPGARIRVVPVLVGKMGCGKSTFVENMLPENLREPCLSPALPLDAEDDKIARACRGKSVVLLEEMKGLRRAGWARLKDLTTATDLRLVPKYVESEDRYLRTWAFIGCSNEGMRLPDDPVAAQRFLPIPLRGERATEDPSKWLKQHRKRLFRQAYHRVTGDAMVGLDVPMHLRDQRREAADEYSDLSDNRSAAEHLMSWFSGQGWVEANEVRQRLPEGTTLRGVSVYLRELGAAKRKRKDVRGWVFPDTSDTSDTSRHVFGKVQDDVIPDTSDTSRHVFPNSEEELVSMKKRLESTCLDVSDVSPPVLPGTLDEAQQLFTANGVAPPTANTKAAWSDYYRRLYAVAN